jgi:hypothetical protein
MSKPKSNKKCTCEGKLLPARLSLAPPSMITAFFKKRAKQNKRRAELRRQKGR